MIVLLQMLQIILINAMVIHNLTSATKLTLNFICIICISVSVLFIFSIWFLSWLSISEANYRREKIKSEIFFLIVVVILERKEIPGDITHSSFTLTPSCNFLFKLAFPIFQPLLMLLPSEMAIFSFKILSFFYNFHIWYKMSYFS